MLDLSLTVILYVPGASVVTGEPPLVSVIVKPGPTVPTRPPEAVVVAVVVEVVVDVVDVVAEVVFAELLLPQPAARTRAKAATVRSDSVRGI
jgi:hypothetical protein